MKILRRLEWSIIILSRMEMLSRRVSAGEAPITTLSTIPKKGACMTVTQMAVEAKGLRI